MTIAKGNKRLPVVLSPEVQEDLAEMKKKYGKSQSKIGQIALQLLIDQEKAGFRIKALEE